MTPTKRKDDITDIQKYYDSGIESERSNTHQLEFIVTTLILESLLKKPARILELGAGSGFYSALFAKLGHSVVSVELSPKLADKSKALLSQQGLDKEVQVLVGDARDLKNLVTGTFDFIAVMGPLYHLTEQSERLELLQLAKGYLNADGKMALAFLSRVGLVSYMMYKHPTWIESGKEDLHSLWQSGQNSQHPRSGEFRGYFSSIADIQALIAEAQLEIQDIYCQDPSIGGADEIFNRLPDHLKLQWAKALFEIAKDPDIWGSGRSILAIVK